MYIAYTKACPAKKTEGGLNEEWLQHNLHELRKITLSYPALSR